MLWVLGFLIAASGLCIWLEFGCMIPRSGGEKVYLEAVYRRPRYWATVLFAIQAIALGFTGTVVNRFHARFSISARLSIFWANDS